MYFSVHDEDEHEKANEQNETLQHPLWKELMESEFELCEAQLEIKSWRSKTLSWWKGMIY